MLGTDNDRLGIINERNVGIFQKETRRRKLETKTLRVAQQ